MITFQQVKNDAAINTYIRMADQSLVALGYTEHSFAHVMKVADTSRYIPVSYTHLDVYKRQTITCVGLRNTPW